MKTALAILILLTSIVSLGQHNVTIKGNILDDSLQLAVSNPIIEVYTKDGKHETQGTANGLFEITFQINSDTLIASLEFHADNNIPTREALLIPIQSDTILTLEFGMPPAQECHDSFLPSPIFFDENDSHPKNTDIEETLTNFFSVDNNDFFNDAFRIKSGLTIYCVQGYSEDPKIAQKRAEYISQFISSNELLTEQITIVVVGKDDYFYCTHCDGCFAYYKYGQGIELNEVAIKKNPDLDTLRQVIELKWDGNKKN